jgi:glyoxylase-like metal-dependent hydrolase (beta-lactamase superfamily II)
VINEIADNFYMLTLPMPFRLEHVNVFLVVYDKKAALFDTGINYPETFPKLEALLETIGVSIYDIEQIFITHYHGDHCGIAGRIKDLSGAVIHASEIGKQIRDTQENQDDVIREIKNFYARHGMSAETIHTLVELFRHFRNATIPYEVDICLDVESKYRVGEREFEVLPTPGHTRDHVCYFFRDEGILLSGDHVLPDITPNLSPDLYAPDFRPLKSFLDSLTFIQDLPVVKVFPAHGSPYSNLRARIEEIKEHHRERKDLALQSVMKGPRTSCDVSIDIFGRDLPDFDKFLALNETYVHLVELVHDGMIRSYERNGKMLYQPA